MPDEEIVLKAYAGAGKKDHRCRRIVSDAPGVCAGYQQAFRATHETEGKRSPAARSSGHGFSFQQEQVKMQEGDDCTRVDRDSSSRSSITNVWSVPAPLTRPSGGHSRVQSRLLADSHGRWSAELAIPRDGPRSALEPHPRGSIKERDTLYCPAGWPTAASTRSLLLPP